MSHSLVRRLARGLPQDRSPQICVQDDACGVDDAACTASFEFVDPAAQGRHNGELDVVPPGACRSKATVADGILDIADAERPRKARVPYAENGDFLCVLAQPQISVNQYYYHIGRPSDRMPADFTGEATC
jgi:hypothetical protein